MSEPHQAQHISAGLLREISVAASVDPRTLVRVLRGKHARGMADGRIRAELERRGIWQAAPVEPTPSAAVKEVCLQLGLVIRQRRVALGLTQEQLARRVKSWRGIVGRVERSCHGLTVETLERYARGLACRSSELLAQAELLALEARVSAAKEAP